MAAAVTWVYVKADIGRAAVAVPEWQRYVLLVSGEAYDSDSPVVRAFPLAFTQTAPKTVTDESANGGISNRRTSVRIEGAPEWRNAK